MGSTCAHAQHGDAAWGMRFGAPSVIIVPVVSGTVFVLPRENRGLVMSSTQFATGRTPDNPVDMIEHMADLNDWAFDRSGDDEISISVAGSWTDYHVSFNWRDDLEALHLACAFDLKVPERRRGEVATLIMSINEQLWLGHFDLWAQEGVVMFRHALLLSGGAEVTAEQCEALLSAATEACERYYQSFQFVVWAGKTYEESLETVIFETAGQA